MQNGTQDFFDFFCFKTVHFWCKKILIQIWMPTFFKHDNSSVATVKSQSKNIKAYKEISKNIKLNQRISKNIKEYQRTSKSNQILLWHSTVLRKLLPVAIFQEEIHLWSLHKILWLMKQTKTKLPKIHSGVQSLFEVVF